MVLTPPGVCGWMVLTPGFGWVVLTPPPRRGVFGGVFNVKKRGATRSPVDAGGPGSSREGRFRGGVKCVEGIHTRGCGSPQLMFIPAVTYSPTPFRVQYHQRCGS